VPVVSGYRQVIGMIWWRSDRPFELGHRGTEERAKGMDNGLGNHDLVCATQNQCRALDRSSVKAGIQSLDRFVENTGE
jgi:hypothetical protein